MIQVLVTGGETSGSAIDTSKIYDINMGTWSRIPADMPESRVLHLSTLLNNNHVLIAGGIIDNRQTTLYYDPTSSTGIETGSMISSYCESPTVTLLTDGRVLLKGGATAAKLAQDTKYMAKNK